MLISSFRNSWLCSTAYGRGRLLARSPFNITVSDGVVIWHRCETWDLQLGRGDLYTGQLEIRTNLLAPFSFSDSSPSTSADRRHVAILEKRYRTEKTTCHTSPMPLLLPSYPPTDHPYYTIVYIFWMNDFTTKSCRRRRRRRRKVVDSYVHVDAGFDCGMGDSRRSLE